MAIYTVKGIIIEQILPVDLELLNLAGISTSLGKYLKTDTFVVKF